MVTPAMRTTAVSARFFKLDKYAMFSFTMRSGLASDSDEVRNHHNSAQGATNLEIRDPVKMSIFCLNPLLHDFFHNISRNLSRNRPEMGRYALMG